MERDRVVVVVVVVGGGVVPDNTISIYWGIMLVLFDK